MLVLDHVAVAAETLGAGQAAVEAALGVPMQAGGRHAAFGTHNMLLGLEGGLYLEVIAVDPGAVPPGRARWFDLDRFAGAPRPASWVCRVADLDAALCVLPEAGEAVALARGDLRWRMAVPRDGRLPFDGVFPALIAWEGDLHPARMLAPRGCALEMLVLRHPRAVELAARLGPFLDDGRVRFETGAAGIGIVIATPFGRRVLG